VHPAVLAEAPAAGAHPAAFAAEGGEDYEVLVGLPPEFGEAEAAGFQSSCGLPLTRLGIAKAGAGVRFRLGGQQVALRGFDHFR
jgi:thiamine monophosphate kinase